MLIEKGAFLLQVGQLYDFRIRKKCQVSGGTIVGPNLWGLWSPDLRPNLISPLFARLDLNLISALLLDCHKSNNFPLQREDAGVFVVEQN